MPTLPKIIFVLALALSFTGLLSPPVALTVGILFGLSFRHPYISESRRIARALLQCSVVALGFGMNLHEVLKAGRSGFIYTALGISFSLLVGRALGKFLRVRGNSSFLITTGTAICGGSAIATTVKLARALWIVPLALATAAIKRSRFRNTSASPTFDSRVQNTSIGGVPGKDRPRIQFPWFILFFVLAALANTYLPALPSATKTFFTLGRLGLTATLFLIGSGISRATLKEVGWRPLLLGVLLWLGVGLTSLHFIRTGLIAF